MTGFFNKFFRLQNDGEKSKSFGTTVGSKGPSGGSSGNLSLPKIFENDTNS